MLINWADQLALLVSLNLACPYPSLALEWLQHVGYYRLSAYFLPLREPGTDQFRAGTSFNDITHLYDFDAGLRLATMRAS